MANRLYRNQCNNEGFSKRLAPIKTGNFRVKKKFKSKTIQKENKSKNLDKVFNKHYDRNLNLLIRDLMINKGNRKSMIKSLNA